MRRLHAFSLFGLALLLGVILGTALRPFVFPAAKLGDDYRHSPRSTVEIAASRAQNKSTILTERTSQESRAAAALSQVSAVERFLWLATQAEQADPAQLAQLLRLAKREGHPDLARAIAARWAALAPAHMFRTLIEDNEEDYQLWRVLFRSWAKSNPRQALQVYVATDGNHQFRQRAWQIWNELVRYAPEIGIEAASEIRTIAFIPDTRNVKAWAASDPPGAAARVAKHMRDEPAGWEVMKEIGKTWGRSDPEAALSFAASLASGLGNALSTSVVRAWTQDDPEAAAAFVAAETDPARRAQLGKGLATGLAKSDPELALAWSQEHLRSTARADAIADVVKTVAADDTEVAAALVANMNPGGALNQAVAALVQEWYRSGSRGNDAMLSWLGTLPDLEARNHAVERLEWRLASQSKTGLIDFVAGEHGHLATEAMVERASMQRARHDPESAVAWARSLPEDRSSIALTTVLDTWRGIDPDEAAAWEEAQGEVNQIDG